VSRPVGHLYRCPDGYLGHPFSDTLSRELKRVETEAIYQKRVFFIQNLGFITPTEARRISFVESLRFERVHEEIYRNFDFELVPIAREASWREWMRSSALPRSSKVAHDSLIKCRAEFREFRTKP
jgi:hypothetical protein